MSENAGVSRAKRVAILGAGPAGLAAAMALSRSPEYSVHVYQMGWKAGGKCATGREAGHLRTLQNGSHYLFGCYENSFGLLAEAHRVLAQHPREAQRFGSFERDLVPRHLLVSKQPATPSGAAPPDWVQYMPQNMARPGDGTKLPTSFDFMTTALQFAVAFAIDLTLAVVPGAARHHLGSRLCQWALPLCPHEPGLRAQLTRAALAPARVLTNLACAASSRIARGGLALGAALLPEVAVRAASNAWGRVLPGGARLARQLAATLTALAEVCPTELGQQLQRAATLLDFVGTIGIGYHADGLSRPGGFARIDHYDFREWLALHGARPETCQSAIITSWYDAIIAYEGGDVTRGRCAAGLTVHSILRAMGTYKGAFAYQLRAEVGDSLIAPVVRALELRGVQFHFFQRVARLEVDAARGLATRVLLSRQIADPPAQAQFVAVRDHELGQQRQAWPAQPQCAGVEPSEHPLDSYYNRQQVGERELTVRPEGEAFDADDERFDRIIAALPLQVMEDVLVDAEHGLPQSWRDCFAELRVVESQAIRMWFGVPLRALDAAPDQPSLGWPLSPPILSGHAPPHSTWEDNSQAVGIHGFPASDTPRCIATLFGPLPTGNGDTRSAAHLDAQRRVARAQAWEFVDRHMLSLWPGLRDGDGQVAWHAFIDLENRSGCDRFLWQDVVANVGPNESYIACLPGTLRYRIRPHESGFANLFIAGDWTRNGFEIGTVEAAVASGLKAAKALSGLPIPIFAEHDLERGISWR